MPYTTPLDRPPSIPSEQAPLIKDDKTPSREFASFMSGLRGFFDRIYAALGETGQTVTTVGALPTAVGKTGVRYMVTDANATTFMSTVAAGGANVVPVVSDGTVWKIG